MGAEKIGARPGSPVAPATIGDATPATIFDASTPAPPREAPTAPALPPSRVYGQQLRGAAQDLGAPGGVAARFGFGLAVPDEFGALPLEVRTKLALDVALKRRRKVDVDDAARLAGWREDYGRHLVESSFAISADGVRFGDQPVKALEGAKGRTTLGIFVVEHPDGPRILKLLPQTGFHDALAGNLLAEKIGGPKIHRFGKLEVTGGTDRLTNYHTVMFIEMEQLFPGDALGRLKELMKAHREGAAPRLPLERLAAGLAEHAVQAMLAGVSPNDPDLLFDRDGRARFIDGDFYQQVFDPEETVGMLRVAFREHGWDALEGPFRQALLTAVREAPLDDRKRRNLLDAAQVF